jgi:hypothetical protein
VLAGTGCAAGVPVVFGAAAAGVAGAAFLTTVFFAGGFTADAAFLAAAFFAGTFLAGVLAAAACFFVGVLAALAVLGAFFGVPAGGVASGGVTRAS